MENGKISAKRLSGMAGDGSDFTHMNRGTIVTIVEAGRAVSVFQFRFATRKRSYLNTIIRQIAPVNNANGECITCAFTNHIVHIKTDSVER